MKLINCGRDFYDFKIQMAKTKSFLSFLSSLFHAQVTESI